MIQAAVFGATGYTGHELIEILCRHPEVRLAAALSRSAAGQSLRQIYPGAPDVPLLSLREAPLDSLDVAFLCLPHAAAADTALALLEAGVRVVDLSADFRLRDAGTYSQWYGVDHPAPQLLQEAVYGLTEFARDALPGARLVATPGCYPTSILLGLQPLITRRLAAGPIIADAKSGVSGAGRSPRTTTHFVEVSNNFAPYKIGRDHRHLPEMEQAIQGWWPAAPPLIFSPHLLPVPRGILSTIYVPLAAGSDPALVRDLYERTYAGEPFVQVLPEGELASLAHVNHSNRCVIGLTFTAGTLVITSALDNLVKGAAGQAVQSMNLVFGLAETAGLTT